VFVLGIARRNEPTVLFEETLGAARASAVAPDYTILVDNGDEPFAAAPVHCVVVRPATNVGCAGAWNIVLRLAFGTLAAESAILLSADCAVAPDTFGRMLASPASVVCALGFSCFRLDQAVWRTVGEFDEAFWPAYWEDTDYRRRLALADVAIEEWPLEETAHPSPGRARYASGITHGKSDLGGYQGWKGKRLARFQARLAANRERYVAKWGGLPGEETFSTPFGI
jgi:GT2 family glycosyltransferase